MADSFLKVGDVVFCRSVGSSQFRNHTIVHTWPERQKGLLDCGTLIDLTEDFLPPVPDAVLRKIDENKERLPA